MNTPKTIETFEVDIHEITSVIEDAFVKLRDNEPPVLGSLMQDVETLCNDITASEKDVVEQVQPKLVKVISQLDELADEIGRFQAQHEQDTADE